MSMLLLDQGAALTRPSVVCLGFFDGVHIGHRRLVSRAVEIAKRDGLVVCVHTLSESPARVMRPQDQLLELTSLEDKAALLEQAGAEVVAVSRFDSEMQHMPANDFFQKILVDRLCARHVVVGFHYAFGYRGEGTVQRLAELCASRGMGLDVVEPVCLADGELVSSTAIRKALSTGNTARAEEMLGRPCTSPLLWRSLE